MKPPCVIKNHYGQTALLINKGTKHTWYIPMNSAGLTVVKEPHKVVLDNWKHLPYDIHAAAVKFKETSFTKTDLVEAILDKLLDKENDFGVLD
jgi:hypothetical protein